MTSRSLLYSVLGAGWLAGAAFSAFSFDTQNDAVEPSPIAVAEDIGLRGLGAEGEVAEARPNIPKSASTRRSPAHPFSRERIAFEPKLALCVGMAVSNRPAIDDERYVRNYIPFIEVNGVNLAVNPTTGACLASAFGPRHRGMHKGVDYHARDGAPILAAGDGVVREMTYRNDYGNMLLIDHGNGVFTRYAHLEAFAPSLEIGAQVKQGDQVALMGNTAGYSIPVHLHYEILTGDYDTPRGSFGLEPRSPFTTSSPEQAAE